jgi:Ser/Thr protein kinase RdoA (MazF antagonist)
MDGLRRIANDALAHYNISCQSLAFIGHSASAVYQVTDRDGNRFSLRIYRPRSENLESFWTSPEAVRSEMMWLHALSRETDITLPVPVRNSRGEWVTVVDGVACVLLTWVDGEARNPFVSVEEVRVIGEMTGKMHRQSSNWTLPESFSRPSLDDARIMQALEKLEAEARTGGLPADETALLLRAGRKAIGMMNLLGRSAETWGVIHADLIPGNILFHGTEARPIDFGACAFGHYLIDLGWTMCYVHPSLRAHLLRAYAGHFALPNNHVDLLEGFYLAAMLDTMNFWLGLPDWTDWMPGIVRKLAGREASAYLRGESFLFGGTPYWE